MPIDITIFSESQLTELNRNIVDKMGTPLSVLFEECRCDERD